jgi:hypothetical protein
MNEVTVQNNIQSLEQRLEATFAPVKKMLDEMKVEHNEIMALEITPENCLRAKELSKKYQKLRSATDELHKNEKAFYLNGGRKVDEWKKETYKLIEPAEKESKERAEHFELIEKARIAKLQAERELEYKQNGGQDIFTGVNFGEMTDEVWNNFLAGVKASFEMRKAAEEKAEQERKAKEAEERAEQARIKAENERLRKEAEERDAKERAEREKIQKENDEKLKIERAEREKKEQELKAIQEAEKTRLRLEKEAAEKAEKERIAKEKALSEGSDKEKWSAFVAELEKVTVPKFETELYQAYLNKLVDFFAKTVR